MRDKLPKGLTDQNLVTKVKTEDPEVQRERAETVKTKSVSELSSISGPGDFPLPTTIERMVGRNSRPVERKKNFREKQRSQSTKNIHEQLYDTLPKQQLLCKAKVEDPDKMATRRSLVTTKSVGELSQIHGLSDFPVPTGLSKMLSKSKTDMTSDVSVK